MSIAIVNEAADRVLWRSAELLARGGKPCVFHAGKRYGGFDSADHALSFVESRGWGAGARVRLAYPPDYWPADEPRLA